MIIRNPKDKFYLTRWVCKISNQTCKVNVLRKRKKKRMRKPKSRSQKEKKQHENSILGEMRNRKRVQERMWVLEKRERESWKASILTGASELLSTAVTCRDWPSMSFMGKEFTRPLLIRPSDTQTVS